MDLDAFSAVHGSQWARLGELAGRRRLTGAEADELVRLYQAVATHLATIRSTAPDPAVVSHLSDLLNRARIRIAGAHEPAWADVTRFAVLAVPAALYRIRWWTFAVMVAFIAVAVVAGVWTATNPDALAAMGTPSERQQYAEEAFASYYSEYDSGSFATLVWTNNAWIALQCVALGISGIWPLMVLTANAVTVGGAGAIMAEHGSLDVFFALILPHGQLELTAIFVAGAAGLRMFWTLVDPGNRPRGRALAEEGRSLFAVALGLVGVLAVAGLVEGFVTPSGMPWWLKIVIGTITLAAFWAYTLVLGRRAVAGGETGDVRVEHRGDVLPIAG